MAEAKIWAIYGGKTGDADSLFSRKNLIAETSLGNDAKRQNHPDVGTDGRS